ncbi:hypothetical protein [Thioclava sp. F28-4]|uniref:hypothetical protein n=1 Tax=Thioclava sp. F28-4 TaxID=1915315 RepID=UPI000998CCE7|nr:hypothetical protein [Thioclava sp. F28-4]OOY02838.1 hypothetical protein BMI87_20745 [Thioclava sp. F28-4]
MLIFWTQKLVFLATPKAGSSAVETALESLADVALTRPAVLKHASARDFRDHLAPLLSSKTEASFTTVALMREPLDWLRSLYRFRLRDLIEESDISAGYSFEQFARDYIEDPRAGFSDVPSQAAFLCDDEGTPLVDRIFPYERIEDFVHFLEDQLGFAITLPRVNVPPAVETGLAPETEAALRVAMQDDIALYDRVTRALA